MRAIVEARAEGKIKHGPFYVLLQDDGQKAIGDKDEYREEVENDMI